MKCPDCDSDIGDRDWGRWKCPQCKGVFMVGKEGVWTPSKPPREVPHHGGKITRVTRHPSDLTPRCIGCGKKVTPGLCHTGSVIAELTFRRLQVRKQEPILGTITTWDQTWTLGGRIYHQRKSIPVTKREKGYLCDTCASDPRNIVHKKDDGTVTYIPYVVTSSRLEPGSTVNQAPDKFEPEESEQSRRGR